VLAEQRRSHPGPQRFPREAHRVRHDRRVDAERMWQGREEPAGRYLPIGEDLRQVVDRAARDALLSQASQPVVGRCAGEAFGEHGYQAVAVGNACAVRREAGIIGEFVNSQARGTGPELAIVAGTEQTIKNTLGDERMKQDLFNHLLGCGIVARRLAKTESTIDPGEAFLGGLLHDIGKLLLLSADIHMEQSIAPRATTERQLRTEREHYGVEHQELGQRYAELMGLPSSISRAIGNHHAPSDADGLQSTIYRANRLSRLWTIGSPADPDTADASNLDFELHGDTDAMGDAVLTEYRLLKEAMAN